MTQRPADVSKMPVQIQMIDGVAHTKVRIPVSVNESGEWIADGWWERDAAVGKRDCEEAAAECGLGNVVTHYVYALVPLPASSIIHGDLED